MHDAQWNMQISMDFGARILELYKMLSFFNYLIYFGSKPTRFFPLSFPQSFSRIPSTKYHWDSHFFLSRSNRRVNLLRQLKIKIELFRKITILGAKNPRLKKLSLSFQRAMRNKLICNLSWLREIERDYDGTMS